jgi:hypothetical protein
MHPTARETEVNNVRLLHTAVTTSQAISLLPHYKYITTIQNKQFPVSYLDLRNKLSNENVKGKVPVLN